MEENKRIGIARGKLGPVLSWEEWQEIDDDFETMITEAIEEDIICFD